MEYREGHETCDATIRELRTKIAELEHDKLRTEVELLAASIALVELRTGLWQAELEEKQAQLAELDAAAKEPTC